jgi:NADPH:quinone reductase
MKAARFHEIGGPEVLRVEDVDKPKPGPGQALVKVHVVGVNFADTLLRRGAYISQPSLPETPGYEAAGTVEEVGPGVESRLVGQRVVALAEHCYAEYVSAPAEGLIPLPDAVSFETGAAFPVQALTAYHMLFTVDKVDARKTVLVHAAAGGVGLAAIQMAKLAGARVFGTTSSQDKARLAKEMGADEVILYNETNFAEEVHRLTSGRGVDLVLDSVGKATQEGSMKSLAPFGHLVSYGIASGVPDPVEIPPLYEKSLKVSAFWLFTVLRIPEVARAGVEQVLSWITAGQLRLHIGLKLPLGQAAEAHRRMEARETVGKILLIP